jgi:hypothetical protein
MGGYENLNEIDNAFVLSILTGGLVLRFDPTIESQRESIKFHLNSYLNSSKLNENYLIATLGTKLFGEKSLENDGHSFSLLDIIKTNETILLKVRNSQKRMKLKVKLSKK